MRRRQDRHTAVFSRSSISTPLNPLVLKKPILNLPAMTNTLEKHYGRNVSTKAARSDSLCMVPQLTLWVLNSKSKKSLYAKDVWLSCFRLVFRSVSRMGAVWMMKVQCEVHTASSWGPSVCFSLCSIVVSFPQSVWQAIHRGNCFYLLKTCHSTA